MIQSTSSPRNLNIRGNIPNLKSSTEPPTPPCVFRKYPVTAAAADLLPLWLSLHPARLLLLFPRALQPIMCPRCLNIADEFWAEVALQAARLHSLAAGGSDDVVVGFCFFCFVFFSSPKPQACTITCMMAEGRQNN